SHDGGRRRGGGASRPRRPVLFREISCSGPELCRREGGCHPHHDVIVAISTMEIMQLLYEIIFLLTPDDRSSRISGYAGVAVACVANEQLGAEDRLGLSGISRRGQRGHLNGMLNGICRRGQRGQNDQNAEDSRKVIVGHVLTLPPVRVPAVRDATIALEPP